MKLTKTNLQGYESGFSKGILYKVPGFENILVQAYSDSYYDSYVIVVDKSEIETSNNLKEIKIAGKGNISKLKDIRSNDPQTIQHLEDCNKAVQS